MHVRIFTLGLARGLAVALTVALMAGCYGMRPSNGGGQTVFNGTRHIAEEDVALAPGYRIEKVADSLTFPTGVTFDGSGRPCVVESGYCYGEVWTTPRLVRVNPDGSLTTIARGGDNGPWNGVTWSGGAFYVAEGGELHGGRILRISPGGAVNVLVSGLPSMGDHHTNGPVVSNGWVYFGQGTATNSAVVGQDNAKFGWVKRHPDFHDIPGRTIQLTGENFTRRVDGKMTTTGAYLPVGTASQPGQIISGKVPCTGAIMRVRTSGGAPELVAWGFRNPFGLGFSPDGTLYATDNGYDERGSRPVFGTGDVLWRVQRGAWHGWPDYSAGRPLDDVNPLIANPPNQPPRPAAILGVHSSADGFDFSRSDRFGHRGEAFIALFGDQAPGVGKTLHPVGFKIVRVDPKTGVVEDFAINKGRKTMPASKQRSGGLERPVAARFDPSGSALYVVDFGVLTMSHQGAKPYANTGVLWRITRG